MLGMLADELCSSVGSLTNSSKIADTLQSVRKLKIDSETIGAYLRYLTDCVSVFRSAALRREGEGNTFPIRTSITALTRGLCNARLNFRQIEETHLMENIIYNELLRRGLSVGRGVVSAVERSLGKQTHTSYEIDFVVNAERAGEKYYIQSALRMDDEAKRGTGNTPVFETSE